MRKIWMPSIVAAITLAAGIAAAQSPPPPAPGGAFESLSPGNQKIALAIYDSERRVGPNTVTKPRSLDDIAEMKQGGKGWGEVFKEMKSQGLVQDRNLGQAVSRQAVSQMSRGGGATAAPNEITTASSKTANVGGNAVAGGRERSGNALSGRQANRSNDAIGNAATSNAVSNGRDGGGGASSARGNAGSHGRGRGK
jgi:hypothetical protein